LADQIESFRTYKKDRCRAWVAKARTVKSPERKAFCLNLAAIARTSVTELDMLTREAMNNGFSREEAEWHANIAVG
jgi:hypothetical protein